MLRKFSSKTTRHRSAESPKSTPQTSNQPSHSSTPARRPSLYGSRYSELPPQGFTQTPRSSDRAPYSATGTPRTSNGTPYSSTRTPHSSDASPYLTTRTSHSSSQPPRSPSQTPRSSASAPRPTIKHYLSPPPPDTPYDEDAWAKHDYLLYSICTRASDLERIALAVEARWRAAEAATPPSKQYTIGRAKHIPTMVEVHQLLTRLGRLKREERTWRRDWYPRSPMLKHPAWGNVYSEAVGVHQGEGQAPWDVLLKLDAMVDGLLARVKEI